MAIGILEGDPHERRHDIESFYWLLVWITLRHTAHSQAQGTAVASPFASRSVSNCTAAQIKRNWLMNADPPVHVHDNSPLSDLLENLRKQFLVQQRHRFPIPQEVTHAQILDAMDAALEAPGWPENDPSIPHVSSESSAKTEAIIAVEHESSKHLKRKATERSGTNEGGIVHSASECSRTKKRNRTQ